MNATLTRRRFIHTTALLPLPAFVHAQRADAIRILCGYPAGGSLDIVSRKLAEKLQARSGAVAIVENRLGAAGRIAVTELKKSPPDGRHLLVTPASVLTMYPHVYPQLGYDVFRDVQPVCTVAATAFAVAVGPRVPAHVANLAEFLRWCRANRTDAQCGNAGAGSMPHFMAILLAREAGIELDHIPFKGGNLAMQAVAAGDIACALATESAARPLHQAGRLRVLATTGAERTRFFQQTPTFGEEGYPALVQREWFGVFVPGSTSPPNIASLADALRSGLGDADVLGAWERAGLLVDSLSPEQLQAALRREHDFWGPLIRSSGFRPES